MMVSFRFPLVPNLSLGCLVLGNSAEQIINEEKEVSFTDASIPDGIKFLKRTYSHGRFERQKVSTVRPKL
jgi:hypothetical protein